MKKINKEEIISEIKPAMDLVELVGEYFDGTKKSHEFEALHHQIKDILPNAKKAIKLVKKL